MEDSTCDLCSICLLPFSDPVRLETGHVYDRKCILAWFQCHPTNPTCPLSNVSLETTELFGVTRGRALQWKAALPPSPREPTAPTHHTAVTIGHVQATQKSFAIAFVWAMVHVATLVVSVCLTPDAFTHLSASFPLFNRGASYAHQPWRPVTSLFTNTNSAYTMVNAAFQYVLLWREITGHGIIRHRDVMLFLVAAGALGSFAAGAAFPDEIFAGGFVSSTLLAVHIAGATDSTRRVTVTCCMLAMCSCAISLTKNMEILSHLVALAFFCTLKQAACGT